MINEKKEENLNESYQCIGCGAVIQSENPEEVGYLPASALKKGVEKGQFYCQRCFRLRHYNELQDVSISDDVFLDRLNSIADQNAFVINLIDIFDVEGSIITGLNRFIGNQPFIVVANKLDLLPKSVKRNRILHWVKTTLYQFDLKPEEVLLISANNPDSMEELIKIIEREVKSRDIYIVGVTNVGKSTLINQLIQHYGGQREVITTSNHPGTTLDLIQIPFTEETALIDTPGIIRRNQLAHYLDRSAVRQLLPHKTIKPRTFQVNPDQTFFIGAAARIDFVRGEKSALTFYLSNDAPIHRTKLEGADEFYQKHRGNLLSPPAEEHLEKLPELTPRDIKLEKDQDIAMSGLGWVTANQSVQLRVWLPKGVQLNIRDAII